MLLSEADRARITAAIAEAEGRTAGEIVVITSTERHRYAATCLSVAALLALALPVAALVTGWSPAALFGEWSDGAEAATRSLEGLAVVQVLVFVAVLAGLWFGGLGRALTPMGLRRDRVHRAALTQFKARALDATMGRTGVLIYIDVPEHIAEVIADTGIFAKVSPEHWATTVSAVAGGFKAGTPGEGIVAGVALAGGVLAEHFPRAANDTNELPDHLVEI